MLDIIYDNIKLYGGFYFVGSCILVSAYWIRLTLLEMSLKDNTDKGSNTTPTKRRLE